MFCLSQLVQSGEIDYVGSIFKCGNRRVRTLWDRGVLAPNERALGIARRSNTRKARVAPARWLAITMHAMLRHGTVFQGP